MLYKFPDYRIKYFKAINRNFEKKKDNTLHYYAGPVKIMTSGYDQTITLSVFCMWDHMLPECLETAKYAWGVKDEDIIEIDKKKIRREVVIKYNLEIINLYLENKIIFA